MSSKPRRNEEIRSRSCHWHSCRSKRNSDSAVTNELSGQRGRPPKHSPSERVACQVACACSENADLLTHTMHRHISPASQPSPTHSPRLQAHARSCPCPVPAILRSSTRSCNSHGPHALAVRNTQSPQRQPGAKRHAAMEPSVCHTHTHRRRATTGCNPNETSLPMQAANNAGLTGAGPRRQPAREPAAAHHGSGRATPTATTTAPPACLSTHGTLARVRRPRVCAYQTEEQRGGGRRQGFC